MGVLTDLRTHRFILHQHLDTHTALAESPIGHQPLTDTLPPPIQRITAIYQNNVQRAQHHTRLALNAIDTLARFPPAAYFTDPNLTTADSQHTPSQAAPPPSHITPLRFYPIPTAAHPRTTLQDAATQTFAPEISILDNPLTPPGLNQSQQTTPRPDIHHRHVQTDIHATPPLQASSHRRPLLKQLLPPPLPTLPTLHHLTPLLPPISSLTSDGTTWISFPPPQSPFLTILTPFQHFLPLLAAHRATSAPRLHHVQPPPPALGNRTHAPARRFPCRTPPHPAPQQFPPTVHPTSTITTSSSSATRHQQQPPATGATGHRLAHFPRGLLHPDPLSCTPIHFGPTTTRMASTLPRTKEPQPQPLTTPPPASTTHSNHPAPPATAVTFHPPTHFDAQGRPLPLHQQEYDPHNDPWHADNH